MVDRIVSHWKWSVLFVTVAARGPYRPESKDDTVDLALFMIVLG